MKRVRSLLLVCTLTFLLTGCVKFNANMDIKKDKSMDFSIIYAFDTSVFGDEEILKAEDKKNLENQGFAVANYTENTMKGFIISKKIKNIDAVSSDKAAEYSLSGILEEKSKNNYIFEVKKGILKNTYKAKLKFDSSDSDLNDSADQTDDTEVIDDQTDDTGTILDDASEIDDNTDDTIIDSDYNGNMDFSNAANMDLSFNVTLPYSAKSSNATTKNNDNKELTWNLSSNGEEAIEFEFELYNMMAVYTGIGISAFLIIALIIYIIKKKKGKKTKETPQVNNQPLVNDNIQNNIHTTNQTIQTQNIPTVDSQTPNQNTTVQPELNQTPSIQPEINQTPNQNNTQQNTENIQQ